MPPQQGFLASGPLLTGLVSASSPLIATPVSAAAAPPGMSPSPPPSLSANSISKTAKILEMLRAGPAASPAPASQQHCLLTSLLHTAERQDALMAQQQLAASEGGASSRNAGSVLRPSSGSVSPTASAPSTRPHSTTDGNSDAGGESSGEEGEAEDGEGMSLIFTRRRAGQTARASNEPVVLNRKRVQQLFDLPLKDAAALLGISMTALKKACRKIGVERWPYRKVQTPKANHPTSPSVANAGSPPHRASTVLLTTATSASSVSRWVHAQAGAAGDGGEPDRMAVSMLLC
mmetsp:Transcript_26050/g.65770  ORF Transcript_26050/g.65770 Transcript_26050/m.65770 type:complete len:290 (+) Transcript_26050:172-1041(+)